MSTIVLWVLFALFALKIAYNILVPFELLCRPIEREGERTRSISLMPYLETGLLLIAIVISFLSQQEGIFGVKRVIIFGGGCIAASFALMFVVGIIVGWIASRLKH